MRQALGDPVAPESLIPITGIRNNYTYINFDCFPCYFIALIAQIINAVDIIQNILRHRPCCSHFKVNGSGADSLDFILTSINEKYFFLMRQFLSHNNATL